MLVPLRVLSEEREGKMGVRKPALALALPCVLWAVSSFTCSSVSAQGFRGWASLTTFIFGMREKGLCWRS